MIKRYVKIFVLFWLVCFTTVSISVVATGNTLNSIHSHAVIQDNGVANIRQWWIYDDTGFEKTEHSIHIDAIHGEYKFEIFDKLFSDCVVSLNGEELTFVPNWDVWLSSDAKQGAYGITQRKDNTVDLHFGISHYGQNEFYVEYNLYNALYRTHDGFNYFEWSFVSTGLDPVPNQVSVLVETADDSLLVDKAYGFGFSGVASFMPAEEPSGVSFVMNDGTYDNHTKVDMLVILNNVSAPLDYILSSSENIEQKINVLFANSNYDMHLFYGEKPQAEVIYIEPQETVLEKGRSSFINWVCEFGLVGSMIVLVLVIVGWGISIIVRRKQKKQNVLQTIDMKELDIVLKDDEFYYQGRFANVIDFYPVVECVMNISHMSENVIMYFVSSWISSGAIHYVDQREVQMNGGVTTDIIFELKASCLSVSVSSLEKDLFTLFQNLSDQDGCLSIGNLICLDIGVLDDLFEFHMSKYEHNLGDQGYISRDGKKTYLNADGYEILRNHVGFKRYLEKFNLIYNQKDEMITLENYHFHMAYFYGVANEFKVVLEQLSDLSGINYLLYDMYYGYTDEANLHRRIARTIRGCYTQHKAKREILREI